MCKRGLGASEERVVLCLPLQRARVRDHLLLERSEPQVQVFRQLHTSILSEAGNQHENVLLDSCMRRAQTGAA